MELVKGEVYQFRVIDIDENYDSFKGNTGLKYCHRYCMELNGIEYDCQVCTDTPKQNFCQIGDNVQAKVGKFNQGQYTMEKIIVANGEAKNGEAKSIPVKNNPTPSGNILLRGSAAEIALQQSVQFTCKASQMPGIDFQTIEDVLSNADKIYTWLIKKNK